MIMVSRIVPADRLGQHTSALERRVSLGSTQVAEGPSAKPSAGAARRHTTGTLRDGAKLRAPDAQEGIAAFFEKREPLWSSESRS
jgi:enoyl-CoA hydratase/carnithine racemase